jgi:hypothetical protein
MFDFITYIIVWIGGALVAASISQSYYENKQCTIIITDMQGVQHVIRGKAD